MKWILFSFVFFGFFIGGLVFICVRQDNALVSQHYYQDELKYGEKIQQKMNTRELAVQPSVSITSNQLKVFFPMMDEIEKGELKLIRPSNEKLDQRFEFHNALTGEQSFSLEHTERGLYRVSLTWSMKGRDYYFEKVLVL